MECLGGYTFVVMTSVILSGGVKMRVEHGMLRGVYISCHDFFGGLWRRIVRVLKVFGGFRGFQCFRGFAGFQRFRRF